MFNLIASLALLIICLGITVIVLAIKCDQYRHGWENYVRYNSENFERLKSESKCHEETKQKLADEVAAHAETVKLLEEREGEICVNDQRRVQLIDSVLKAISEYQNYGDEF
jgi:hypothetical protein